MDHICVYVCMYLLKNVEVEVEVEYRATINLTHIWTTEPNIFVSRPLGEFLPRTSPLTIEVVALYNHIPSRRRACVLRMKDERVLDISTGPILSTIS